MIIISQRIVTNTFIQRAFIITFGIIIKFSIIIIIIQ